MKKLISLLLLASIASSTLACGGGSGSESSGDTSARDGDNAVTTPALTGREAVLDNLPEKNYNGKTFSILTRTVYDYEFAADEENGDLVNDAVYKRNGKVEDRFNVVIETIPMPCNWGDEATAFNTTLRNSISADDGTYDLVQGYAATIPNLVGEGLFHNWLELDHVDFTKPWWSTQYVEELSINGKCFMVTGDASLALWKNMRAMFFNKVLAQNYKIGDIYTLVRDGKWTLDKLIELTKDVYADLDSDGTKSDDDRYGFLLGWSTEIDNMKEAFEIPVTEKDANGFPVIAVKSDRMVEAVEKINAYVHESGNVLLLEKDYKTRLPAYFSDGNGLFFGTTLGTAETMRSMNDDFGIIPYPKYNEAQADYHSTSLDEFSAFVIPLDAKDTEMTAIITEALCAESYKIVVPTFYDIVLKTKGARDNDSSEMIDIIRDGLTFDFGYLHSSALGSVGHKFVGFIRNNDNGVISSLDANMATYEEKLVKVLEIYR